jgi:hypothetical protein
MNKTRFWTLSGILLPVIAAVATTSCYLSPRFKAGPNPPDSAPKSIRTQPEAQTEDASVKPEMDMSQKNNRVAADALSHFRTGDFAWLEKNIRQYRKSKERVAGGVWLLRAAYIGLENPDFNGGKVTDDDWRAHFEIFERWKDAYPDSISARIAAANAWTTYAWEVRGTGYANTVSDENLRLFEQRISEAKKELTEARRSDERCPEWYSQMLTVAQAESADWDEYNEIYDEGVALEPTYYYLYRAKSYYLLPQWHGNEGDWPRFAEETSDRIGGDEGKMLYFILVADMYGVYRRKIFLENKLSWERVKDGFDAMQRKYKASNTRLNEFAALAGYAADHVAAKAAFDEIGEKWDPGVWRKKDRFDGAKTISEFGLMTPEEKLARMRGPAKQAQNP